MQRIQLIASAATVVPFVGIVELGRVLLADRPVNNARVWTIVAVVVGALLVRTLASGTALTITPPFLYIYISRYMRGWAATPGRRWRDWTAASHLARTETAIAVVRLLDRLPGLRLDADNPNAPRGLVFRKPPALLVRWNSQL